MEILEEVTFILMFYFIQVQQNLIIRVIVLAIN